MICGPCAFGKHQDCTGLLRASFGFCRCHCADRQHVTEQIRQVDAVLEAQRRAEMNEAIYLTAVRNWFRRTDPGQEVDKESR